MELAPIRHGVDVIEGRIFLSSGIQPLASIRFESRHFFRKPIDNWFLLGARNQIHIVFLIWRREQESVKLTDWFSVLIVGQQNTYLIVPGLLDVLL